MPKLTSEQNDALSEAISRQLYRINKVVRGMFGQELSDEEILRAHGRIKQGVDQSMRQMEDRKGYTPMGGEPKLPNLPPETFAEGGFINEGSR